MVNDDNDTDDIKEQEKETPFGQWQSPNSRASDGAPQAVVSNADGTQRPAQAPIPSFSATFGAAPSDDGQPADIYGQEKAAAPSPKIDTEEFVFGAPIPEPTIPAAEEEDAAEPAEPKEEDRSPPRKSR